MKSWTERLYIERCSSKETSGAAKLLAGLWQLKGMESDRDKGKCPLCLGEEDILLDCLKNRSWRITFLNRKWLVMNKLTKYRKLISCTNEDQL
jgi:hypothetical protein